MHSLELLEQRVLNALDENVKTTEKTVRRPRLIPIVVDGQVFWASPQGLKIQNYVETLRGKVVVGVSYEILKDGGVDKVEISLETGNKAAA